MYKTHFKDDFRFCWAFADEFVVICPRCAGKARVLTRQKANEPKQTFQLVCPDCGLSQSKTAGPAWHCHADRDWVFGLPLYYTITTSQGQLCAFNEAHLQYIEDFVSAKNRLRRRDQHGWANQSQISRLPKWVKLAKNRALILAKIRKLKRIV
ncbi:hypothetical protein [Marinicella meishanensis]|uniref:hypothetical protein n=1 Tax=Marinicella meishanensis TaxID=2873263 RepID=UPI001CBCFFD3|nr:hypothetical protein [Marinicella sp. NBU2979]